MNHSEPFMFYTERRLVSLTGLRARNLPELLGGIREVSGSSIFYHTHHLYLSHHFETPVFYNEFALWVSEALREDRLAEQLAGLDLLSYTSIRQLREAIIARIESHLETSPGPPRDCPPGDEFHFCKSKSFIMPTGIVANTPADLFAQLPRITTMSLYFHFFEARLRLGHPTNDFSYWLEGRGEPALAKAIDNLDPYIMSLDELKNEMIALGTRERGN